MSESKMNESQANEQTWDSTSLAQDTQPPQPPQELQASTTTVPDETTPFRSPGTLLAARREQIGMSLEQVAEQLKMTPRRVLEIEADNLAAIHSKAIHRGFVRAYAKVLRMDPDPLIAMISDDVPQASALTPVRSRTLETFSEVHLPFIAKYSMQSKRMTVAIILVVILIVVLLGQKVGWIPSLPKMSGTPAASASASVSTPVSAPVVVAPTTEVASEKSSAAASVSTENEKTKQIPLPPVDVSSQVAQSAPKKASAASVRAASKPAPVAAKIASPMQPAPVAATSPNAKNMLVLKCREESWVELKRANGELMASRYIPAGTTARFTITEPMQLTVGNAPAVEATLRGTRLKIHTDGDNKVVRLNIK